MQGCKDRCPDSNQLSDNSNINKYLQFLSMYKINKFRST